VSLSPPALVLAAPPLAHFGHWYISLPTYMSPVVVVAAWIGITSWRDRRRGGPRAGVETSSSDERTVIRVTGPLTYPSMLDIETELEAIHGLARQVVLDLRHATSADPRSMTRLGEIIEETVGTARLALPPGATTAPEAITDERLPDSLQLLDDAAAARLDDGTTEAPA
jgi:hypothetical protein